MTSSDVLQQNADPKTGGEGTTSTQTRRRLGGCGAGWWPFGQRKESGPPKPPKALEFWLVLLMLGSLLILVLAVLFVPPTFGKHDGTYELKDIFQYRSTVLGVILTAFGAWIGAGAAYFFGRENLKTATEKMMEMREPSAQERLRRTAVRNIPPKPLDWRPRATEKLKHIYETLRDNPEYWFVPIFDAQNRLLDVMNEEAFWRYVSILDVVEDAVPDKCGEQTAPDRAKAELLEEEIGDFIERIRSSKEKEILKNSAGKAGQEGGEGVRERDMSLFKRFLGIYVSCTLDESAADVYRRMLQWRHGEEARLAIVVDENGKATHFFTTEDVRRLLVDIA